MGTKLNPCYAYMFERVHPEFTIVIPAATPRLYHIGTRDMSTLQEVVHDISLPRPAQWTRNVGSLSACRHLLDGLHGQREGLVIRDAAFRRLKLKRRDYVLLHGLSNGPARSDYSWVARAATTAALHMTIAPPVPERAYVAYETTRSRSHRRMSMTLETAIGDACALCDEPDHSRRLFIMDGSGESPASRK